MGVNFYTAHLHIVLKTFMLDGDCPSCVSERIKTYRWGLTLAAATAMTVRKCHHHYDISCFDNVRKARAIHVNMAHMFVANFLVAAAGRRPDVPGSEAAFASAAPVVTSLYEGGRALLAGTAGRSLYTRCEVATTNQHISTAPTVV